MKILVIVLRAALFLVVLPILAYAATRIFLPQRGFIVPMAGEFDLGALIASIVFIVGFLTWAQYPAGRGNSSDEGAESEKDFEENE